MYRLFLPLLALSSFAFAQSSSSQGPRSQSTAPSTITLETPQQAKPADVPETGAVITLKGLCPGTTGSATGADCQTLVTRAQFERMVNTLNPQLPPDKRQALAQQYAQALILQDLAERQGLADTPHFKEMMDLMRTQVLAQEFVNQQREKAKPTSAEVEDYYNKHQSEYEEAVFKRLYIPKSTPSLKETAHPQTMDELKAEADKIRTRLAAGEDFDKVEKEVYTNSGIKTPPPPTSIPNWRRTMVPPAQAFIFDMKQGEVSQPIVQPEGIYIYKMESKKIVPLNEVRANIESTLAAEKMRASMSSLLDKVNAELNPGYFGNQPSPQPAISASPKSAAQPQK